MIDRAAVRIPVPPPFSLTFDSVDGSYELRPLVNDEWEGFVDAAAHGAQYTDRAGVLRACSAASAKSAASVQRL